MDSVTSRSPKGLTTASILLGYVPKAEHPDLLRSLIESVVAADQSTIDFTASLIEHCSDRDAREAFLAFIEQTIVAGSVQCAVSLSLQHHNLGIELLSRAACKLSKAKSRMEVAHFDDSGVQSYLEFCKCTFSLLPDGNILARLLDASLNLLSTAKPETCMSARSFIFALLSVSDVRAIKDVLRSTSPQMWNRIRRLASSQNGKHHTLLAYSLWLRWILSDPGESLQTIVTDEYWQLLLEGLRHGDTERRKLCLSILKLSMAADAAAVSKVVRHQFDRYCTIFETIVLSRYINQVQECESDLDILARSPNIESKWMYTLLAAAVHKQMQDSNRKFIGNWVMRSGLTISPDFQAFFQESFLPWAIQGHLFVSSLKRENGVVQCLHGGRLARFIRRLLQDTLEPSELVDIIVDTIHGKRHSLFAYATVYLLEGVGSELQNSHKEKISGLPCLPEVARDYVSMKVGPPQVPNGVTAGLSRKEAMEQDAIEKCHEFNSDTGSLDDIWSDLEYLECPKNLLMVIPNVAFSPQTIERATKEPDLALSISEKLHSLQTIAETKTYLFSPLVCAIRKAMATTASTAEVLDITAFVIRIAGHPPEPTVDLLLEEATTHLTQFDYQHYFGEGLSFGYAALLDLVSRLQGHHHLVKSIIYRILERWKAQKIPPPSVSTWKNTLQLQILLLCLQQYCAETSSEEQALLEDVLYILAHEPLPLLRFLLEWTVAHLVSLHGTYGVLLEKLKTKDHHANPKHLASLMKTSVTLACRMRTGELNSKGRIFYDEDDDDSSFAFQLATVLVPLAASSKIVIRHEAQWQFPILMDQARAQKWTSITNNEAFLALDDYIRSLARFDDPPLERQFGRFNPNTDHTLANLVGGRWFELDSTEAPLTRREDFVKLYRTDKKQGFETTSTWPESCMELGGPIERQIAPLHPENDEVKDPKSIAGLRTMEENTALQTKGIAYLARTRSEPPSTSSRPSNLIVVGSLVDNPYNLGGLSRVSEIFGASALTLQNQNVLSNKDFTSVSVSSHLHLPMIQLSTNNIPTFLTERKAEGFTVVGIEQTDRSVMLGSEEARLPEKVVLVVGSEKEGIPAVVLAECDMLVEIPQEGVTRSLNVQTAVSIVLYDHARQHSK